MKKTVKKGKVTVQSNGEKKAPGVIAIIKRELSKSGGVTKEDILGVLKKQFPDRETDGMARTVQIQISRIPKEDKTAKLDKAKDEKRGWVYKLTHSK